MVEKLQFAIFQQKKVRDENLQNVNYHPYNTHPFSILVSFVRFSQIMSSSPSFPLLGVLKKSVDGLIESRPQICMYVIFMSEGGWAWITCRSWDLKCDSANSFFALSDCLGVFFSHRAWRWYLLVQLQLRKSIVFFESMGVVITILGGLRSGLEGVESDGMVRAFMLLLAFRSRLRFDLEDFAVAWEEVGEFVNVDTVVTVDVGLSNFSFAFLMDPDLERFEDGDTLSIVEDEVRLLGEPSFVSLLEDFLPAVDPRWAVDEVDERLSPSRLEDEWLRPVDDPLFEEERLRAEGERGLLVFNEPLRANEERWAPLDEPRSAEDLRDEVESRRRGSRDEDPLRPREPEVEDLLRLRSDDDDDTIRGFLSEDFCSNLVCFLFDVVDDLGMMIDVVCKLIVFVLWRNYERWKSAMKHVQESN